MGFSIWRSSSSTCFDCNIKSVASKTCSFVVVPAFQRLSMDFSCFSDAPTMASCCLILSATEVAVSRRNEKRARRANVTSFSLPEPLAYRCSCVASNWDKIDSLSFMMLVYVASSARTMETRRSDITNTIIGVFISVFG